jgi:hypothetical protein
VLRAPLVVLYVLTRKPKRVYTGQYAYTHIVVVISKWLFLVFSRIPSAMQFMRIDP